MYFSFSLEHSIAVSGGREEALKSPAALLPGLEADSVRNEVSGRVLPSFTLLISRRLEKFDQPKRFIRRVDQHLDHLNSKNASRFESTRLFSFQPSLELTLTRMSAMGPGPNSFGRPDSSLSLLKKGPVCTVVLMKTPWHQLK